MVPEIISNFDPNAEIKNHENLYRAVRPNKRFWKKNGKLSPAAFKDERGLSLDRDGGRIENKVIKDFRTRKFIGILISLSAKQFRDINVFLKPDPKYWPYHVLAQDSPDEIVISDEKCDKLRQAANFVITL